VGRLPDGPGRPRLTTARLTLEPLTGDHLEDLVALDGDAEVMRHLSGRPMTRTEVVEEWLPRRTRSEHDARRLGYWVGHTEERFVGWWMLVPDERHPEAAELGYRLVRDAWGRGYATEGASALLAHGFGVVGLARVWAEPREANLASIGVLRKLGFSEILRREGEVRLELLRESWPHHGTGAESG